MKKTIGSAVAAAVLASAALAMPANAGGKNHGFDKWRWHKPLFPVYSAPVIISDCDTYFFKWRKTGSFFWKKQYFACKAGY